MRRIPISEPYITKEDVEFVARVLSEAQVSGRAPIVEEFEQKFKEYLRVRYAIACSSGTAALHLAVKALGLSTGEEVIAPAFTMMSPIFAILYVGAKPTLVDVDPNYWVMDVSKLEKKITNKTKAIMVVHTYGNPVDMNPIMDIARSHGLYVIEDAAEALGASYYGVKVGSLGDLACFSFFANKLITCGEGGMVVTNDSELYERLYSLRDLCFGRRHKFLHDDVGYNYRMSALQAALGLSQLGRIEKHYSMARKVAETYRKFLQDLDDVMIHEEPPWGKGSYWMFSVVLKDDRNYPSRRDRVMEKLKEYGVETRPFFVPVHKQPPCMSMYRGERYSVSEWLSDRGLNLPSSLTLQEEEIQHICEKFKEAIDHT